MNHGLIDPRIPDPVVEARWGQHIKSNDPERRRLIAQVVQRQASYMENALSNGSFSSKYRTNDPSIWRQNLLETTDAGDIADFIQQQLALVEMVFERIVIDQLVHVQAMNGPKAFVHNLSYQSDAAYDGNAAPYDFNRAIDPDYSDVADDGACAIAAGANVKITATTITSHIKHLKANFSVAAEQDMQADYRIGLSDRLRSFLALELQREMQQEILVDIQNCASHAVAWNSIAPQGSIYENLDPKVWQATLYDAVQALDSELFSGSGVVAGNFRGGNWLAANGAALLYLEELRRFSINSNEMVPRDRAGETDIDVYSNLMGTANGRWKVWKLPFMTADRIILGTKSDAHQEMAYIHGVYVPISDLGTFRDPATACVNVGVMTRVANACLRPGLFGVITLTHNP